MEGYEGVDALNGGVKCLLGSGVWCCDECIFFIILTPNYGLFRGQFAGGRARAILESNLEPKLCKIIQHRFNIDDIVFRIYEFYSFCHRQY